MRIRMQDANGDMRFGKSMGDFWHDEVDGVGQAILTRLLLYRGEWFLDESEGTPWGALPFNEAVIEQGQILGYHTADMRDLALKERVLLTPGVDSIVEYSSNMDTTTRRFSVQMVVATVYGRLTIQGTNGEFEVSPAAATRRAPLRQLSAPLRQLMAPRGRIR